MEFIKIKTSQCWHSKVSEFTLNTTVNGKRRVCHE